LNAAATTACFCSMLQLATLLGTGQYLDACYRTVPYSSANTGVCDVLVDVAVHDR
jgi:hypothetical protein